MHRLDLFRSLRPAPVLLLLVGLWPAEATAQLGLGEELLSVEVQEREVEMEVPLLDVEEPYILVHVEENRVFLMEKGRALWSAPAGTGTGFRLQQRGYDWTFTTPKGLFRVEGKEKDPLWEAPDWYYIERGLAVPAQNSPRRLMRGVMGTTALYLGDGLAIHGTNSPQALLHPDPERRRISHGCIRLTNEAARELFHRVDVGTLVLIY